MMPSLTVGYQCNKTRQPSKDKGNFRSQHPCTMQVNDTHIRAKRFFFFFFSSRRRHTRFSRDWSSDVCCSDLSELRLPAAGAEDEVAGVGPAHVLQQQLLVLVDSRPLVEVAELDRRLAAGLRLGERLRERRERRWHLEPELPQLRLVVVDADDLAGHWKSVDVAGAEARRDRGELVHLQQPGGVASAPAVFRGVLVER